MIPFTSIFRTSALPLMAEYKTCAACVLSHASVQHFQLTTSRKEMKFTLIIATFFTVLAFINAIPSSSSKIAVREDYDYGDDDGQFMAQMMTSALINSMDEDSVFASTMKGSDGEQAIAQIRFLSRLANRFGNSRLGQQIIGAARNRFCRSNGR